MDITETKLKVNLPKEAAEWEDALYAEYVAAGKPKSQRKWIAERIKDSFKSMGPRPKWVDFTTSKWPFHKGKPMVFVGQIELTENDDTKGLIDGGSVSYFFGMQDTGVHGEVIMVYQTQTLTRW